LWSFKFGDTKLDRFLAKNEQVQMKLLYLLKCSNEKTRKIMKSALSTANFVGIEKF
jgi:hypothetical protein